MLHPPCWKQEGQIPSVTLKQVLYSTVIICSFPPLGVVAHACSPSSWKPVAVGGLLGVPGQLGFQMRSCLKNRNKICSRSDV